ncbi:MAG: TonB-dependent receptor plug domain-containing protein [Vicinamibacterales bacterium]
MRSVPLISIRRLPSCLAVVLAAFGLAELHAAAIQPAPASIAGVVLDAQSHAPVAGADVSAGSVHVVAGPDGRFRLAVPSLPVDVVATAQGYFPLTATVAAGGTGVVELELALVRDAAFTTSVAVVASAPAATPSAETVAPVQVLRTPGALDNVYRTLQTLPGVQATEEFGSRLSVRGGAPDQNLTMMDGVEVHDPYRLFGLTSAFNPETIERFELATGGFSAKYGDRLSSLLVIENRDGRAGEGLTGSASLSITDANVVLDGGLPKEARGSWVVTGRRTYYDLVAARLTDQDFPGFKDLQARATWAPGASTRLTAFSLTSRQAAAFDVDSADANGEFNDDTDNDLAWLRLDATLGGRGQSRTILGYSNTRSTFGVDAAFRNTSQRSNVPDEDGVGTANVVFERALGARDFSLRQELAWALGGHLLETGVEVHRLTTSQRFEIRGDRNPVAANGSSVQGGAGLPDLLASTARGGRGGAWLQDTWQARPALSVQAGLRLDRAGVTRETRLSPRLSATWALDGATRLIAAAGGYTQSPGYEKQAQSDYVLDFTNGAVRSLVSERAWLASAALERDLTGGMTAKVEGYYKRFTAALIGRLEPDSERLARLARYDFPAALQGELPVQPLITTVPTNDGRGTSYGVDVYLSRTGRRLSGWTSYTWGRAEREAYGRTFPFEYDRRHSFTTVASYAFSPRWELAATTRIASGFPRTPPLGVRVAGREDVLDLDGDGVTDEILPARDVRGLLEYVVDYGGVANLNSARLPVFARVDTRLTWRPRGSTGRWELYAELINALGRKNAGALSPELVYDPASDRPAITETRDQAIPRLPTIGVRFRF